jgi:hypothetical protein
MGQQRRGEWHAIGPNRNECDGVIERIRNNYLPGYEKANPEIIKTLLTRMETAVTNAIWLAGRPGLTAENPSTAAHQIVQHLKSISAAVQATEA